MIDPMRYLPSHRRMKLLIRAINLVIVVALLAFAGRSLPVTDPVGSPYVERAP